MKKKAQPEAATMPKTLMPELLTISEFATAKNVTESSVWNHINKQKIVPVYVGKGRTIFIDSIEYNNYVFLKNYGRKKKEVPTN